MKKNTKNQNPSPTKRFVVETYTSWTNPSYNTHICTLKDIKALENSVDELLSIHELGPKVKMKQTLLVS